MTKEELFKEWAFSSDEDYEKEFYADLDKWFDAELKRNTVEMQKLIKDKTVRSDFMRLIWKLVRGQSIESLEEEFGGKND